LRKRPMATPTLQSALTTLKTETAMIYIELLKNAPT